MFNVQGQTDCASTGRATWATLTALIVVVSLAFSWWLRAPILDSTGAAGWLGIAMLIAAILASHSVQTRHEPAAGESEIPAARAPLDAVRESAAGASAASRRHVSRTDSWHTPAVLPIHRDRRLHPHSRAQGLRRLQSTHGHCIHRRRAPAVTLPRPRRAD